MAINKVLCVDDSATDLTNIKLVCQKAGYSVVTGISGAEAVELAESELPDIVFLDIVMKPMNGFQACRKIVRNKATAHIPVILVTSKGEAADRMWGEEQGAKGFVTKPYSDQQILDELNKFK